MLNKKTILGVVPARGGSKGVPGKNLRMYQGKSLLARTIESAKKSKWLDRVIVSSEDEAILKEAEKCGADVPFVRPADLATDETAGTLPILHALAQLTEYDYVIVLQATSPLRTTTDIDTCLQYCMDNKIVSCVSVVQTESSPYWMFHMDESLELKPVLQEAKYTRRQELPTTYELNGAIYVVEKNWFLENKKFIAGETKAFIMPRERSLDIDTEWDFKLLHFYGTFS